MTSPASSGRAASEPAGFVPSYNEDLSHQVLGMIAQHRIVTNSLLLSVLLPGRRREQIARALSKLRREEAADFVVLPASHGTRAWFLTERGAQLTRHLPQLRDRPAYPITSASAASLRTAHTLTVVRAHAAFAVSARLRGDEHGPWDWTPEVAHNLGDGERVIADALMHYTHHASDGQRIKFRAFVEVDRATMSSERLAAKLIEYARFRIYEPHTVGARRSRTDALGGPAWLRWYPAFPRILFILTGAGPTALGNRIDDLRAMVREHPTVAALARDVPLGAAVLEDIETLGVDAPVWHCLRSGEELRPWTEL
ncbi:replication-relaxation family protein [Streptomyces longhuiensis]|uniref:replication-relaxation family protein n=1 Tax=Streptomyces longhuiensis TaxID=2880933 RepID=UPI001D0AB7BF|nr:replication-relaxation family protein [Streptomyces longhuiensis]UDL96816.1 replication-relaxation family protein [Streptomyces longhuiensis]